jgi:hypothetical protein
LKESFWLEPGPQSGFTELCIQHFREEGLRVSHGPGSFLDANANRTPRARLQTQRKGARTAQTYRVLKGQKLIG